LARVSPNEQQFGVIVMPAHAVTQSCSSKTDAVKSAFELAKSAHSVDNTSSKHAVPPPAMSAQHDPNTGSAIVGCGVGWTVGWDVVGSGVGCGVPVGFGVGCGVGFGVPGTTTTVVPVGCGVGPMPGGAVAVLLLAQTIPLHSVPSPLKVPAHPKLVVTWHTAVDS
jgi:hypothetical protein